jgi:ComEC/Rec2-related protein
MYYKKLYVLDISDIAFGVALAFISGVFALSAGWNLYIFFLIAAAGAILIFQWKIVAVFLSVMICGMFYYHLYIVRQGRAMRLPYDVATTFSGVIADEPKTSPPWTILAVSPIPRGPTIEIFARGNKLFAYGDKIEVAGKIKKPDTPGDEPIIFAESVSIVDEHDGFFLREWLIDLKLAIIAKYNQFLPQDQAALLGGITLGDTNTISSELKSELDRSGTSYIMSMYGYKIGVLVFAIVETLSGLIPRRAVFATTGAAIILFVMMAGADASAVRAGIMAFMALIAKYSGRSFDMRNAITFTAFVMLLFDPTLLLYNAGFELSFLSLLGIVYLGPPLTRLLGYKDKGILHWKENMVVAVAAIVAILPITMVIFGNFSATAIFSNALVGIAIPLTMAFGAFVTGAGSISYYAALVIAKVAGVLLEYELAVIHIFSIWLVPIPMIFNSTFMVIAYYTALVVFIFYERKTTL